MMHRAVRLLREASPHIGEPFQRLHRQRLAVGNPPAIPYSLWRGTPPRLRWWFIHYVLRPSERWLDARLKDSAELGALDLEPRTSFSLGADALLALARILRSHKPRHVLEFGSGASTLILAHYFSKMALGPQPRVFSIEHDPVWLEATCSWLKANGLERHVRVLHAPLSAQCLEGREWPGYRLGPEEQALLEATPGFDLCLIDGPPGSVGRLLSLPLAAPHLRPGALVLLDDAYRAGEESDWRRWRQARPELRRCTLHLTAKGLLQGTWVVPSQQGLLARFLRSASAPDGREPT